MLCRSAQPTGPASWPCCSGRPGARSIVALLPAELAEPHRDDAAPATCSAQADDQQLTRRRRACRPHRAASRRRRKPCSLGLARTPSPQAGPRYNAADQRRFRAQPLQSRLRRRNLLHQGLLHRPEIIARGALPRRIKRRMSASRAPRPPPWPRAMVISERRPHGTDRRCGEPRQRYTGSWPWPRSRPRAAPRPMPAPANHADAPTRAAPAAATPTGRRWAARFACRLALPLRICRLKHGGRVLAGALATT